jgi:hypothetical protein
MKTQSNEGDGSDFGGFSDCLGRSENLPRTRLSKKYRMASIFVATMRSWDARGGMPIDGSAWAESQRS